MLGYRFYAEMPEARKSKSASKAFPVPHTRAGIKRAVAAGNRFNVCAVLQPAEVYHGASGATLEAIAAVFDHDNSGVCLTGVSPQWLRERTTHIDEATARKSHPALFARLD